MSEVAPEGWEVHKLGDIGVFSTSSVDKKTNENEGAVKLLNYMDVYRNSLLSENYGFQTVSAPKAKIESSSVRNGDVFFTPSSETPDDIGHSAVFIGNSNNIVHSYHTIRFREYSKTKFDDRYKAYAFKSHETYNYFRKCAAGSTRFTISLPVFEGLEVLIPPLPEQKKIAAILTSVDDVIESTQKQVDKLQDLKKATMNELLTKGIGHTEFKDSELGRIPKSWEVKTLGELLSQKTRHPMRSGPFGSVLLKHELVESGIPFLGIDNVHVERFEANFKRFISETKFQELSKYQVFPNDLIVTIMGTVGRCCIIPESAPTAISSKHTWVITFEPTKVISHLVCWQVNHADWVLRHFADNSQGGVMASISSETLRSTIIPVPPLDEQIEMLKIYLEFQRIGSQLLIKLNQIQFLKKSLMQDLLSGKVRVKVD